MFEELAVQRAAHLSRGKHLGEGSPLDFLALKGRLVELPQERGSACLSFLCARILEAQTQGEPVVWVHAGNSVFFPPDFAANGVDVEALTVVRAADSRGALRAVHHLLHSGAFGMVVLDTTDAEDPAPSRSPGRGSRLPRKDSNIQGILGRFAHLAEKCGTALICLQDAERGLGSMVSLRVRTRLHRVSPGVFRCDVDVVKDKRSGPGLHTSEVYHAPPGLR